MINSTNTSVRILPNNKVYRQLFDAQVFYQKKFIIILRFIFVNQVQLSDAYNRVRNNQLSQSVQITSQPDSIPIVRNIKPHGKGLFYYMKYSLYSSRETKTTIFIGKSTIHQ